MYLILHDPALVLVVVIASTFFPPLPFYPPAMRRSQSPLKLCKEEISAGTSASVPMAFEGFLGYAKGIEKPATKPSTNHAAEIKAGLDLEREFSEVFRSLRPAVGGLIVRLQYNSVSRIIDGFTTTLIYYKEMGGQERSSQTDH